MVEVRSRCGRYVLSHGLNRNKRRFLTLQETEGPILFNFVDFRPKLFINNLPDSRVKDVPLRGAYWHARYLLQNWFGKNDIEFPQHNWTDEKNNQ